MLASRAPVEEKTVATIIANGCFDLLHDGHKKFLLAARTLGHRALGMTFTFGPTNRHQLIVAVNSDESARALKLAKWGEKYPQQDVTIRRLQLIPHCEMSFEFDTEDELRDLIRIHMPCIIVKGPDYAGKRVTGDDIAPVIILDTPEPDSVKAWKVQVYGQRPNEHQFVETCSAGTISALAPVLPIRICKPDKS
jgi:D-beta-D-heptose 7-phosphate kinase/D-beta-D-heptose 1-phosphate adenosyltransferase